MGRRRRREEEKENHERWLVSYAVFITLLFAFFVVMYAISSVNEGKYRVVSNALNVAFKNVAITNNAGGAAPVVVVQGPPPLPVRPSVSRQEKVAEQKGLAILPERTMRRRCAGSRSSA